jgi:hypothetical protein
MQWIIVLCTLLLTLVNAQSKITLGGEVRTRAEWNSKTLKEGDNGYVSAQNRTRVTLKVNTAEFTHIKVTLQDNRYAGTEGTSLNTTKNSRSAQNATNSINSLHVYEAYVDWRFLENTRVLAGRQGVKLGSGRFIDSDDWYSGLSFDGVRLDYKMNPKQVLSVMGFVSASDVPSISKDSNVILVGAFHKSNYNPSFKTQLYGFYERNNVDAIKSVSDGDTHLFYLGERLYGNYRSWFYDQEFILQIGKVGTAETYAFNSTLRLGKRFQKHIATLGFDMMTGDDNNSEKSYRRYENKYAQVHNVYGTMDYIQSNLEHGVIDIRLDGKFTWEKWQRNIYIKPEFHFLMNNFADRFYGTEYDLNVETLVNSYTRISFGGGLFLPNSNGSNSFSDTGKGIGYHFYAMPTVRF